jgi:hypothetical protein
MLDKELDKPAAKQAKNILQLLTLYYTLACD